MFTKTCLIFVSILIYGCAAKFMDVSIIHAPIDLAAETFLIHDEVSSTIDHILNIDHKKTSFPVCICVPATYYDCDVEINRKEDIKSK